MAWRAVTPTSCGMQAASVLWWRRAEAPVDDAQREQREPNDQQNHAAEQRWEAVDLVVRLTGGGDPPSCAKSRNRPGKQHADGGQRRDRIGGHHARSTPPWRLPTSATILAPSASISCSV